MCNISCFRSLPSWWHRQDIFTFPQRGKHIPNFPSSLKKKDINLEEHTTNPIARDTSLASSQDRDFPEPFVLLISENGSGQGTKAWGGGLLGSPGRHLFLSFPFHSVSVHRLLVMRTRTPCLAMPGYLLHLGNPKCSPLMQSRRQVAQGHGTTRAPRPHILSLPCADLFFFTGVCFTLGNCAGPKWAVQ